MLLKILITLALQALAVTAYVVVASPAELPWLKWLVVVAFLAAVSYTFRHFQHVFSWQKTITMAFALATGFIISLSGLNAFGFPGLYKGLPIQDGFLGNLQVVASYLLNLPGQIVFTFAMVLTFYAALDFIFSRALDPS